MARRYAATWRISRRPWPRPEVLSSDDPGFWPWLFEHFGVALPSRVFPYSMDPERERPLAPAYLNLGFVALNPRALSILNNEIWAVERRTKELTLSPMRAQIALTLIGVYRASGGY